MPMIEASRDIPYRGEFHTPGAVFDATEADADYYVRFGYATYCNKAPAASDRDESALNDGASDAGKDAPTERPAAPDTAGGGAAATDAASNEEAGAAPRQKRHYKRRDLVAE
jgi:hypothetical protein